jgi:hypothetical protein
MYVPFRLVYTVHVAWMERENKLTQIRESTTSIQNVRRLQVRKLETSHICTAQQQFVRSANSQKNTVNETAPDCNKKDQNILITYQDTLVHITAIWPMIR